MGMANRAKAVGVLCCVLALSSPASASDTDFFEQHIRPVLVEKCYSCHSTASDPVKGGLLLDSAAGMAKGGASGLPATATLLEAIRYQNPDLQMPPKEQLPAPVVAAFERWIAAGAVFPEGGAPVDLMAKAKEHWAFHAPQPQALPEVKDAAWPRTEIDYFLLHAMEAKGLSPTPEADRRTLIRRLSFDLLGLPPAAEEVTAFVNDPDPQAYEKVVERYLASPHYGERWARHWLDVARYADTKGYVYGDREAVAFTHSHTYRDWVVNALNHDMPYDQFVKLQLAADTVTGKASREDLAAMGFLTLGPRFLGVMPDIIDDRIDTMTRGLMGLTVSCARCHDHKFDPIPTADYYSLYGVFSASSERTTLLAEDALQDARYAPFAEGLKERETKLQERFAAKTVELEERLRGQVDRYLAAVPTAESLPTDDFYEIRNTEDLNPTIVRRWSSFNARQGIDDPVFGAWNRLAPLEGAEFAVALRDLLPARRTPTPPSDGDFVLTDATVAGHTPNARLAKVLAEALPKDFSSLAVAYGRAFKQVNDEWLALAKQNPSATALPDADSEALRAVLVAEGSPIRVPQGAIVDLEWMFDEPSRVELATLHANIDRWITGAETAPQYAVILADKPDAPPARVFLRGSPASPGEEVPRQFLSLLSGENRAPFAEGSGRRELADAIASKDNPLTARVMVNRVWAWHFGEGLVDTPSDFGTRSGAPSHPELLDWLAQHFVEQGWSLKQIHRLMVLSAAYRQGSVSTDSKAAEADPENRLLWRFNAHRLDFESLRDALLFASGALDPALGGRPVELAKEPYPTRRTLYGRVDRQFLPAVFRVFDFPNPDMHSPTRIDTTVPQQALFLMNNPFVQQQARVFAAAAASTPAEAERVAWLYQRAYQRAPSEEEAARALEFIRSAEAITPPPPPEVEPPAWSYGYGKFDEATGKMASFTPLPHFTGSAWQGGANWPDATLGWAQITATGGHPGNTLDHAIVRRWTAPASGKVQVEGRIRHARTEGDGIMARVSSSRQGLLGAWFLHNSESDANLYGIAVEAGDTLDFVVDIKAELNSDEHKWSPMVTQVESENMAWNAEAEFAGPFEPLPVPLAPWEKLAQVLLSSNEFLFVD
jgi:hypothetical protein